ncbi:MAG: DUF1439 domain-containing protein [Cyanothece sp. SIO2G6]|nr:DUF1439 domain-containing protein [Cyanothece sp. SIO2G6]
MKRSRIMLGIGVAIAIILITLILIPKQLVIAIPQSEIQQELEGEFPLQEELMIFATELRNPLVDLDRATERVTVTVETGIRVRGTSEELIGDAMLSSGVDYNSDKGTIYLTDIRVEQLNILPLPQSLVERVTSVVNGISTDVIDKVPIHTLKTEKWKQWAIKWALKDVAIADDELIVTLGR